ncbi:MAG: hypothetical protein EOO53_09845 [Gammaproteobacteria bacterium]|nr:MAG: hypothetical protein EOO53_09845 [Gammaproteobacteria bacterium]
MLKAILNKTLVSVSLLAVFGVTNISYAADVAGKHQKHSVVDRKTERVKTDNGFTRTESKTDAAGATAFRRTDVVVDKDSGSRSKSVSGNTFEGKTYTEQSISHKTETGYVSQGQLRTSDGKVVDRSVTATVDKTAGTITKDISVTPQGEETRTKTVVHSLKKNR